MRRAALEAGADPVVVSGWIAEVQGGVLSPADLRTMVEGLADVLGLLGRADPVQRGKVYADLVVTLTYRPDQDLVEVRVDAAIQLESQV